MVGLISWSDPWDRHFGDGWRVTVEVKEMELQDYHVDDLIENIGNSMNMEKVDDGATFNWNWNLNPEIIGDPDCLVGGRFFLEGPQSPLNETQIASLIDRYGGRVLTLDDLPSERGPYFVVLTENFETPLGPSLLEKLCKPDSARVRCDQRRLLDVTRLSLPGEQGHRNRGPSEEIESGSGEQFCNCCKKIESLHSLELIMGGRIRKLAFV
jgi:hypothetical protein